MFCQLPIYHNYKFLTHWGRVTHICVGNLTIIGSDNGLSPGRRQAIIWSKARILLIEPLRTNFSEILIEIHTFSFKKMHLKMSSGKWRPFCLGLNIYSSTWYTSQAGTQATHRTNVELTTDITFHIYYTSTASGGMRIMNSWERETTRGIENTLYTISQQGTDDIK